MKKIFNNKEGFALLSVMMMVVVLLMLMVSLLSLTSESLFEAGRSVERASLITLAEAGLNEAMLKLYGPPTWGTNKNEILFMKSGGQGTSVINHSLDSFLAGGTNSPISYNEKGFYYISFDPNDPTGYYSVNNLNNHTSYAAGWRDRGKGTNSIPPESADIVATVAIGSSVRHVEVILKTIPAGGVQNGSRGATLIYTNSFTLEPASKKKGSGDSSPSFHTNGLGTPFAGNSMGLFGMGAILAPVTTNLSSGASVTAKEGIFYPAGSLPPGFNPNVGEKEIPTVDISTMLVGTTAKLSPGTYEYRSLTKDLRYVDSTGTFVKNYSDGDDLITSSPGVAVFDGKKGIITVNDNVEVEYNSDPAQKKDGNLNIIDATVTFGKKVAGKAYIYADSDIAKSRNITGKYLYGNIDIIETPGKEILTGQGNIYCQGGLILGGKKIDAGYNSDNIALYANGDIKLITTESTHFRGLVYTTGNFLAVAGIDPAGLMCAINSPLDPNSIVTDKNFTVEGALIVAGQDPNTDPTTPGYLTLVAKNIDIKVDNSVIENLNYGGNPSAFSIVSWHEF